MVSIVITYDMSGQIPLTKSVTYIIIESTTLTAYIWWMFVFYCLLCEAFHDTIDTRLKSLHLKDKPNLSDEHALIDIYTYSYIYNMYTSHSLKNCHKRFGYASQQLLAWVSCILSIYPLGRGPAYSGLIHWGLYSRPIALTLGGEEFRLMMYASVCVTVG